MKLWITEHITNIFEVFRMKTIIK